LYWIFFATNSAATRGVLSSFIRDHVAHGDIELAYVCTKDQLADIFTKPLDEARFGYLRNELNIIDSRSVA
jgi:hypothetical protein